MSEGNTPLHGETWLERLARESWQLELLISGFVLFLLAGSYDGLQHLLMRSSYLAENLGYGFIFKFPALIVQGSWLFLFLNLLLHVVLRGMWIAAVGLKSVSGDIEFDKLRFDPIFAKYLNRKMGSFDDYIHKLERLSSTFFAFTFLVVFVLVSFLMTFFVFLIFVTVIQKAFDLDMENSGAGNAVVGLGGLAYFVLALIYAIDFITLGYFKRQRDIHKVYMPIYRLFSFITLAPLYRPLYYNMIDNRFGRRLGRLLVPYFLILSIVATGRFNTHRYFPHGMVLDEVFTSNDLYDDRRADYRLIHNASIPSRTVDNDFLEVFVKYRARRDEPVMEFRDSTLRSGKWMGFVTDIRLGPINPKKNTAPDSMLMSLTEIVRFNIGDSIIREIPNPKFYVHTNAKERGIITTLDLQWLPRGIHELNVEKLRFPAKREDTLEWRTMETIPFVLVKD